MKKIGEVLRLRLDRKARFREIAAACQIGRSTVDEYIDRAESAGLGWPLPEGISDEELTLRLFPSAPESEEVRRPLPDWGAVQRRLGRKGQTLPLVWQDYVQEHPEGYRYSRFADPYRLWCKAADVRMIQVHKAGEKMFVDWSGLGIAITDPKTVSLAWLRCSLPLRLPLHSII